MKIDRVDSSTEGFFRFMEFYLGVKTFWMPMGLPINNYTEVIFSLDDEWTWLDLDHSGEFPQLVEIPDEPKKWGHPQPRSWLFASTGLS